MRSTFLTTTAVSLPPQLLGYASVAITLDTYSHRLPGIGDGLADAMDEALR